MIKTTVLLLFATVAVIAAWNVGWLSYGSAQSLTEPPLVIAERQEPPAFRGVGAVSPNVSDLPRNNVVVEATGASESHVIPPKWLPSELAHASVWARPLLADGVVTLDERNAALLAAQRCTVEGTTHLTGVVNKELTGFPGPTATFGGASAPTHDLLIEWSGVHQACVAEYWRDVVSAWSAAESYARIAPIWNAVASCMREAGASLTDGAEFDELLAVSVRFSGSRGLYDSCNARVAQ